MNYKNKEEFEKVNMFEAGMLNMQFSAYFTGKAFLNPLVSLGESPISLDNITFEPGCRNNWHVHRADSGGGQILICTAGEGWYQREGKKPLSLAEGSFVYIPEGVKHWHGAKKDSWFSHISIKVPGENPWTEWLETTSDQEYGQLRSKSPKLIRKQKKYQTKDEFKQANMFGTGMYNFMLAKYFKGRSYLKMIAMPGKTPLFMANVTFEPGCRNNWHIHHANKGGGQILICTAGQGWYQEEGKEAVSLKEGSVVYIPAEVNHWHGAKKDTWFSHIALEIPGENVKNEWRGVIGDSDYERLQVN